MTHKDQWLALAERCEGATGPDREIDIWIENYCGIARFGCAYRGSPDRRNKIRPLTSSLDAITTLIEKELPGSDIIIRPVRNPSTHWPGKFSGRIEPAGPCDLDIVCRAATQALALCAAFCRAMAAKESSE